MRKGSKLAVLVESITNVSRADPSSYEYEWFVRINRNTCMLYIALPRKACDIERGDLVILEYWHEDRDGDQIWRVYEDRN